eukprot:TRINITY_DN91131_c0_g1_i1.p1 TRINITY_DN91131_c0_g1~~TRINITY_DN91131_c0_g1_i1.p1  ORF type:complete len:480 (-),score=101.35 TRINITY_DN91131_c0_g1_i1:42-1481(-)
MGAGHSNGPMAPEIIRVFFDPRDRFAAGRGRLAAGEDDEEPGCDALAAYTVLGAELEKRVEAAKAALGRLRSGDAGEAALDRSLGCILGNIVGDALGAPLEFSAVRYHCQELKGLDHVEIWQKEGYNSFNLKPGQWTDDGSMALCILDSLLCCGGFDAYDIRQRFHGWNSHGYNNAFGRDSTRKSRSSVGLGGNISSSMTEWERKGTAETTAGNKFTSGNGSLMRNGAIPVWFRGDLEAGMEAARRQSLTTHAGHEASELCRLLTFICTRFLNGAGRELLDDLSGFECTLYTVKCLANGECEKAHEHNADPVFGGLDRRRWDWRSSNHRYCTFRAQDNPGYIGSYAMDCMSMALHCVYTTGSFTEATLKAANMCGDADTVCAVTGQLAGALYGVSAIPESWLQQLERWDGGSVAARALMAHEQQTLAPEVALGDVALASAGLLGKPRQSEEDLHAEDLDQGPPPKRPTGVISRRLNLRS